MALLGIDFGSSFTTVSWINPRNGKPEVVKFNGDGSVKYPSVIMGTESGLILGYQALSYLEEVNKLSYTNRYELLSNFIPSIKRILDEHAIEFIGNKKYSHLDLLTSLFKNIRLLANAHCGNDIVFDSVTFSHPVEFSHSNVRLMEQALKNAGFSNIKKEIEPISAVRGYSIEHQIFDGEGILVFDFGGGTVDVAYVQKCGEQLKTLCAPKGNSMCGGQDFDLLIYEDLRKCILQEFNMDITSNNCIDYSMLNSCRRLKEHFSGPNNSYDTSIVFVNNNKIQTFKYKLSREAFNNIIYSKVNDAISVAKSVIKDVEEHHYKINKILLIGGSSQLTLVRELLSSLLCECIIDTCGEKDIAVALGNIYSDIDNLRDVTEEKVNINKTENHPLFNEPLRYDKSIECKNEKCKSKHCYKLAKRVGYHCLDCGWEGVNVTIYIKE